MAIVGDPVVVTGTGLAVIAHVPLADVRRLVAERLQLEMVVGQAVARRVARHVVDDAVTARVLAGEDRGAVRRADRRGVERALEERALGGDAVDVRRLHVGMAARAELVEAQVVYQDDEEIWFFHVRAVHESDAAEHVGGGCGGKATLDAFFGHRGRLLPQCAVRQIVWAPGRGVHLAALPEWVKLGCQALCWARP